MSGDWSSVDEFNGVWSFLEKEKPSTKFDFLACVCSFAVEKLSQKMKKKKKSKRNDGVSPGYVLNWYTPKKKRSKRPRSPRNTESDLNMYPQFKKLKFEALPDLGVNKVHRRIDFLPKGNTFAPEIVQTLDHMVPNNNMSLKKKKKKNNRK